MGLICAESFLCELGPRRGDVPPFSTRNLKSWELADWDGRWKWRSNPILCLNETRAGGTISSAEVSAPQGFSPARLDLQE